MAPVQVITTPQTGPNSMPLAKVTNSAGNGTRLCAIIKRDGGRHRPIAPGLDFRLDAGRRRREADGVVAPRQHAERDDEHQRQRCRDAQKADPLRGRQLVQRVLRSVRTNEALARDTCYQPRPTNGMVLAITVMNSTLESSGRLAM